MIIRLFSRTVKSHFNDFTSMSHVNTQPPNNIPSKRLCIDLSHTTSWLPFLRGCACSRELDLIFIPVFLWRRLLHCTKQGQ